MIERWLGLFRQNPDNAVVDLFNGRSGLGSSLRRDLPEILFHAFLDRPQSSKDRELLDSALLVWLDSMRVNYHQEITRLDFDVYSKRICDALRIIQLLDLPRSIQHIREVHSAWLRWLVPLRVASERDPALETWRLLSQRQKEEDDPAPWLQLALDRRPEYLTVALLGLQRPIITKKRQILMVAALLHHYARVSSDVVSNFSNFNRHLSALRGRFPRGPAHWGEVLDAALSGQEGHPQHIADANLSQQIRSSIPKKSGANRFSTSIPCPTKTQNDQVLQSIRDYGLSTALVAQKYVELVAAYLNFSRQTGDTYFFVRTLCNHGNQLLKRPHIPAQQLAMVGELIEEALRWEPSHSYIWAFWADWLAYQGRVTHQRWVLLESARLFPGNEACRVELARLLIRLGTKNWPEAEQWLREAAARNPLQEPSRVELARLLIRRGEAHWPEADRWLREVAELHPENGPSRVELARLLILRGERFWPEAEQWLREASLRNIEEDAPRVELARLLILQGESRWSEAEERLLEVVARHPSHGPSRILLAKFLTLTQRREQGIVLLEKFLSSYSENEFARALLDQLRNGKEISVIGDFSLEREFVSEVQIEINDNSTDTSQPTSALVNIAPRSLLQQEYARAHVDAGARQFLHDAATKGEALAGFYYQWLRPEVGDLPLPPHAWAWRAARCFTNAGVNANFDWEVLQQAFPEHWEATRFVRWLAHPKDQDGMLEKEIETRMARYEHPEELDPTQRFALFTWQKLRESESEFQLITRKDSAFAILHANAEPVSVY